MNFVEPKSEVVLEKNPFKKIEQIARCCYKSTDKITEDSCFQFVAGLIKRKHFAMFEHITMSLELTKEEYVRCLKAVNRFPIEEALNNVWRYLKFIEYPTDERYFVTGSIRAYNESPIYSWVVHHIYTNFGSQFAYTPLPEENREKFQHYVGKFLSDNDIKSISPKWLRYQLSYATAHFVTDRGITHELVRHRNCAFAQESTRYVNYLNTGMTFIIPSGIPNDEALESLKEALSVCEKSYNKMTDWGCRPQTSRSVLPTCVKSEIYITAPLAEWEHIFNLRLFGTTGNPHPDMKKLMENLYPQYQKYIE